MTFRGLSTNRRTRQFEVFTTLDSHVKVPVVEFGAAVERPREFETQYPTGVAHRTWSVAACQLTPGEAPCSLATLTSPVSARS